MLTSCTARRLKSSEYTFTLEGFSCSLLGFSRSSGASSFGPPRSPEVVGYRKTGRRAQEYPEPLRPAATPLVQTPTTIVGRISEGLQPSRERPAACSREPPPAATGS
jgi:hypothetical protein